MRPVSGRSWSAVSNAQTFIARISIAPAPAEPAERGAAHLRGGPRGRAGLCGNCAGPRPPLLLDSMQASPECFRDNLANLGIQILEKACARMGRWAAHVSLAFIVFVVLYACVIVGMTALAASRLTGRGAAGGVRTLAAIATKCSPRSRGDGGFLFEGHGRHDTARSFMSSTAPES